MSNSQRYLVFGIKLISAAIIFFSSLFTFLIFGPRIEVAYFPVVGELQITSMVEDQDGVQLIGLLPKYRSCEYIGASWKLVNSSGEDTQLRFTVERDPEDASSPTRPVGLLRVGPWSIKGVNIATLKSSVFAEITHRCHPLWLTTTKFWP